MAMRLSHAFSLNTSRGLDYCGEFNVLGIVCDGILWLLPDPVNSEKLNSFTTVLFRLIAGSNVCYLGCSFMGKFGCGLL